MKPFRCLVVDDEILGRELLILNLQGVASCDSAANGEDALEKYSSSLDTNPYDVIFLDIIMPGMDGHEVATVIRRMELERGITLDKGVKIIVVSSLDTPQDFNKSFVSTRSVAHLIKPIKAEKMKRTLCRLGLISES